MQQRARATRSRSAVAVLRRTLCPIGLILVLAACTAPPTRSGGAAAPVTIRIAYGNTSGSVGSDVIDLLAKSPESPMTLRNVSPAEEPADPEGAVLRRIRQGGVDLSLIRAGRLALEGATAMEVLEAPLVIANDEQAARVAADPLVARTMTSLSRLGLTGLALVPDSLRHPFGYRAALTAPGDLRGRRFSTRPDLAARAIVETLGAMPDTRVGHERTVAAEGGVLRGIETSLDQPSAVDLPAVVTSNLALYEKFDVVVVRKRVFDGLSGTQRRLLDEAVHRAITAALAARPGEDTALAAWCGRPHAAAISLSTTQISRFRSVLDPLAERIARRADATAVLDRMRALHAGTTDPAGTNCSGGAAPSRDDLALRPVGSQHLLDGTWRTDATAAALRAGGGNAQTVANNRGVWTFTIRGGRAVVDQPQGGDCTMRFTFAGERVRLDMAAEGNDACGGLAIGTFRITGDVVHFVWTADVDGNPQFDEALSDP